MSGLRSEGPDGRWAGQDDDSRVEHAVDEEIAFHFARTVEELRARGIGEEEAEAEARRRFGDVATYRSELARIDHGRVASRRREAWMEILPSVLKGALRQLRRSPALTVGVVLTLALGIGANAVTFSLVDRLLLSGPTGIDEPERVRAVFADVEWGGSRVVNDSFTYLDAVDFEDASTLAGVAVQSSATVLVGHGLEAEPQRALLASHELFPLLGVEPALGRFYGPEEDQVGGETFAVLGYAYWRSRYAADPTVLGRALEIGDRRYTVLGVAPEGFTGTSVDRVDLFLPLRAAAHEQVSGDWDTGRNIWWLNIVVRLRPEVEAGQAEAELTLLHQQAHAGSKDYHAQRVLLLPLVRASGPGVAGEVQVAAMLAVVALLVLLIATANVANLLLARALRSRREHAVRLALGVGRRRLLLEKGAEGVILGLLGGAVALLLAVWVGGIVRSALFPWVAWNDAELLWRTLLFVLLMSLVSGVSAALIPASQGAGGNLSRFLQSGARSGSGARSKLRVTLQVAQAAFSVVLLVGAGLFVRSLERVQDIDVGIEPEGLISIGIERFTALTEPAGEDDGVVAAEDFAARLEDRLRRLPAVASVASTVGSAPFGGAWSIGLRVPGLEQRPRFETGGPYIHAVTPGYFETVGTTILRGRGITAEDRLGSPRVALVNETMARVYWPGEDPIGKCLLVGVQSDDDAPEPPCSEVVGVVEDARRFQIFEGESGLYYTPRAQRQLDSGASLGRFFVRARDSDPRAVAELVEGLRREILAFAPDLRTLRVQSLEDRIAPQLRSWRLGAALFSAFGVLALIVATIGLYSVLSFEVAGRRHEIGVRAALGASRAALLRRVVRDGLMVVGLGVLVGSTISLLLAPAIRSQLYGVEPSDPVSHGVVIVVLLAVAVVASWIPARRATRVPPTEALRLDS